MSQAPLTFERPVGACRDVKELEFLACLHQTCSENRIDGSLVAEDIHDLLLSRQGLDIGIEKIESAILVDLVGNPGVAPAPVMDLRHMVGLLTIPHLVRASQETKDDVTGNEIDLFGTVLRIILDDVKADSGEEEYPVLTTSLLKSILSSYGEGNVDEELLEQMIERANVHHVLEGSIMLTPEAFEYALTSDVHRYKPEWETKLSTHFEDVESSVQARFRRHDMSLFAKPSGATSLKQQANDLSRRFTFPQIDLDADTFDSLPFMVILVGTIVTFYVGYYNIWLPSKHISCFGSTFGCLTLKLLVDWFAILAQLMLSGTAIVLLTSLGNHAYNTKRSWTTFFKLLLMTSIIPIMALATTMEVGPMLSRKSNDAVQWAQVMTFVFAVSMLFLQLGQLIAILLPDGTMQTLKSKLMASWLFSAGTSERYAKMAASFKVKTLINNALHLHRFADDAEFVDVSKEISIMRTSAAVALGRYTNLSRQKEVVGGFAWVMRQFWTSALASKEGIFFGARLIASNCAQWVVLAALLSVVIIALLRFFGGSSDSPMDQELSRSVYFNKSGSFLLCEHEVNTSFLELNNLVFGYVFDDVNSTHTETPKQAAVRNFLGKMLSFPVMTSFFLQDSTDDNFSDQLCDYLSNVTGSDITIAIESQSSFAVSFNDAFFTVLADNFRRSAGNLEVFASLVTAGVTGALSVTFIAVSYLPSYVITVLKFRSGVLGSLHDRRSMYLNKMNPFFTTLLVGSSFWGAVFSGAATGIVAGSIVFLLLWDESKAFAEAAIAVFVVIISTTLLRIAVVSLIYTFVSRGFLRNKPATHNFIVLLFEAWNTGNSLGYVISRSFRVLLITLFYLGRLDKWVLADGAGEVHCFHPDIFPRAFNRDLLVHEAHRHPWAERLVTMYMLKIRNGKEFGSRAGGSWRLIFVSALMPWLIGYRVNALPEGITRALPDSTPETYGDEREMGVVDDAPARSLTGYESIRLLQTLT